MRTWIWCGVPMREPNVAFLPVMLLLGLGLGLGVFLSLGNRALRSEQDGPSTPEIPSCPPIPECAPVPECPPPSPPPPSVSEEQLCAQRDQEIVTLQKDLDFYRSEYLARGDRLATCNDTLLNSLDALHRANAILSRCR